MWYSKVVADLGNIPDFISLRTEQPITQKVLCLEIGVMFGHIKELK